MARLQFAQRMTKARAAREATQRTRRLRTVQRRDGVRYEVDGHWLTCFCSNDYLALAQQFSVISALEDGAARAGFGSAASPLVCGRHAVHAELERAVAEWLGYPRALLFDSGYAANLGVLQAFLEEGDLCVQDRLDHASLIDGARLAGAALRRYPHGDAEGALRQLRGQPEAAALLATDGVFSMDGDVAPLKELALVARVQQASLYVDDAHGIGVLGEEGRGSVAQAGLSPAEVPLLLATFGKALGGHGAVVLGDDAHIEHVVQGARSYMYSTALPPALATGLLESVRAARRDQWRRDKVMALSARLRERMAAAGFALPPSETPIQPVPCAGAAEAVAMANALESQGYWVSAIRPPSVPPEGARLRVTLSAGHSEADVDGLVDAFRVARDAVDQGYRAE